MYVGRIVEMARRPTSSSPRPQHPYTEALLSAVPEPDPRLRARARSCCRARWPNPAAPAQRLLLPPALPLRHRGVPDPRRPGGARSPGATSSAATAPRSCSSPAWSERGSQDVRPRGCRSARPPSGGRAAARRRRLLQRRRQPAWPGLRVLRALASCARAGRPHRDGGCSPPPRAWSRCSSARMPWPMVCGRSRTARCRPILTRRSSAASTSPSWRRIRRCRPIACGSWARSWRWSSARRRRLRATAPSASSCRWAPLPAVTASLAAVAPGAPILYDEHRLECVRGRRRPATPRPWTRRSRQPPTWCGWRRGSSASPACRWSRAPPSATGTRRRAATPSTPAPAAWAHADRRGRRARRAGERRARGRARRGRQLRHAQQLLSGVRARGLGGTKRGPAGEVDGRAAGGVPGRLPGARSRVARRAGARCRGRLPGLPRASTPATSAPTPSRSIRSTRASAIATTVYHVPAVSMRGARRRHQHVADHAVPQRRPARGHVRHGAADRPRRPPARLRPPGAAAAQSGAGQRDAVPQPPRRGVRQRRLSRRRWIARSSSADWAGFEARRAEARRRGRYRGIGIANYVELNTGDPRERAHITVQPEGRVDLVLGTLSSGQGHETSFAQLLVEWLGVELAEVRLITGDTDVTVTGGGAHSARALRLARHRDGQGVRCRSWRGARRIAAAAAGGGRGRHRVLRPALPREGHRPLGRPVRGGAAGRRPPRRACATRS